jgi:hypothetical protein
MRQDTPVPTHRVVDGSGIWKTVLVVDLIAGDVLEDGAGVRWTVRQRLPYQPIVMDRNPPSEDRRMTLPLRLISRGPPT